MGIIKQEDLVAWNDEGTIICLGCGDPGDAEPLTKDDFKETDTVVCDSCNERIYL